MPTFTADYLRDLGRRIFEAAGAPPDVAAEVARSLIDANLAGHDSHGVLRIPAYLALIPPGQLNPAHRPAIVRETPTSVLVDGRRGFGQIAGLLATDHVIAKARSAGIAIAGIYNCTHMGRVGEYIERAIAGGCFALATVGGFGGRGYSPPHGGSQGMFGTNPIAFGIGGAEEPPFVGDMATTMVAEGKLRVARAKRAPLDPGWILDQDGHPSTDVEAFYAGGSLLPFGGHKGSAIALLVDLLGPSLTGSRHFAEGGYPAFGSTGTVIVAIANDVFRPADEVAADVDAALRRVRACTPAPGNDCVLIAGDPERRTRAERLEKGIPLPDATWDALIAAAQEYGVTVEAAG